MSINYQTTSWGNKKIIIGETPTHEDQPVRLLIGFHGADSTPENMLIHGNRLKLDNTWMFFPEGPVDAGKGLWSWWEDGPRQQQAVASFLTYTSELIDQAHRHLELRAPGKKGLTCLWGFSQGGAASLVYTLLGNQPVAKTVSICGFLPELPQENTKNQTAAKILGLYGAHDEVVPAFLAEYALDEMKNHGHDLTIKETPHGHELHASHLQKVSEFLDD
jgi:predicted esterase